MAPAEVGVPNTGHNTLQKEAAPSRSVKHPVPTPTAATQAPEAVASSSEELSPEAIAHDQELEYDSMVLLSKLEQIAIRFNTIKAPKAKTVALEYLIAMANHLVEFAEHLPGADTGKYTLSALLQRDARHYTHLQPPQIRQNRLTLDAFTDLYVEPGVLRHPKTFQQLSDDLLRIINVYLLVNVKAFHAPVLSEQWKTVYSGFFVNIAKTIRKIQASQHG